MIDLPCFLDSSQIIKFLDNNEKFKILHIYRNKMLFKKSDKRAKDGFIYVEASILMDNLKPSISAGFFEIPKELLKYKTKIFNFNY